DQLALGPGWAYLGGPSFPSKTFVCSSGPAQRKLVRPLEPLSLLRLLRFPTSGISLGGKVCVGRLGGCLRECLGCGRVCGLPCGGVALGDKRLNVRVDLNVDPRIASWASFHRPRELSFYNHAVKVLARETDPTLAKVRK